MTNKVFNISFIAEDFITRAVDVAVDIKRTIGRLSRQYNWKGVNTAKIEVEVSPFNSEPTVPGNIRINILVDTPLHMRINTLSEEIAKGDEIGEAKYTELGDFAVLVRERPRSLKTSLMLAAARVIIDELDVPSIESTTIDDAITVMVRKSLAVFNLDKTISPYPDSGFDGTY